MTKVFKCADMGFECAWIATAKTENEIMILIKDHANKCHNLKEITKDVAIKVKAVIRDQWRSFHQIHK